MTGEHRGARRRCGVLTALASLVLVAGCVAAPGSGSRSDGSSAVPSPEASPRPSVAAAVAAPEPPAPRLRGTAHWRLSHPARESQIEGYPARVSGRPGDAVDLQISTTADSYRVHAYRIGAYSGGAGRLVWTSPRQPGEQQAAASFGDEERRTIHAAWHRSLSVPTDGWTEGFYLFKLVGDDGWQAHVPYVVRSASTAGKVALVEPVATWQAYDDWGGYDFYLAPTGDHPSWAVSFDRPYPAPGAGEMVFGVVPVVVAAERAGVPLAYLTDVDLDAAPNVLHGARAYVSMGHDEYWSAGRRRAVLAARDAGTNLAFLGANTAYWKVRFENAATGPRRLSVGYRRDPEADPLEGTAMATGQWRDQGPTVSENVLTGTEYECFPVDEPFTITSAGWWGFRRTGVLTGTEMPHLVGVEADRVYPVWSTPRPLEVLSHTSYDCGGVTTSAESAYYTAPSGAGVFNAGTLRWTCALTGRCPPYVLDDRTREFVRTVTATVLRRFATGPAGVDVPATDNVATFALSPVNVVPAS